MGPPHTRLGVQSVSKRMASLTLGGRPNRLSARLNHSWIPDPQEVLGIIYFFKLLNLGLICYLNSQLLQCNRVLQRGAIRVKERSSLVPVGGRSKPPMKGQAI